MQVTVAALDLDQLAPAFERVLDEISFEAADKARRLAIEGQLQAQRYSWERVAPLLDRLTVDGLRRWALLEHELTPERGEALWRRVLRLAMISPSTFP